MSEPTIEEIKKLGCFNCAYCFEDVKDIESFEYKHTRQCRRQPAVIKRCPITCSSTSYPRVYADQWCGEFQLKEGLEDG